MLSTFFARRLFLNPSQPRFRNNDSVSHHRPCEAVAQRDGRATTHGGERLRSHGSLRDPFEKALRQLAQFRISPKVRSHFRDVLALSRIVKTNTDKPACSEDCVCEGIHKITTKGVFSCSAETHVCFEGNLTEEYPGVRKPYPESVWNCFKSRKSTQSVASRAFCAAGSALGDQGGPKRSR